MTINVENEMVMSQAEAEIEKNGIKFTLDIDDETSLSPVMYGEVLGAMLAYIGQFTDRDVAYVGGWKVTIEASEVMFEGEQDE